MGKEKPPAEYERILALIPLKGAPKSVREGRNIIIRKELPKLSNASIVRLALKFNHDLSLRELRGRLAGNKFENLGDLFILYDELFSVPYTKVIGRLEEKARADIERIAPTAPREYVIEFVKSCLLTRIKRDSPVLKNILSARPDALEILAEISENPNHGKCRIRKLDISSLSDAL